MNVSLRSLFRLLILALCLVGTAAWADPDLIGILKRIDAVTNFSTDFTGVYSAVMERTGESPLNVQAQMFRRDTEGKFVILISAPPAQKGQGYLEIDNNLWFYDPQSRLFTHSSLKENWQSSDAMNSDFYRTNYARDYSVESWKEGVLGAYAVYILDLKGTNEEVTYPWKRIWVRKDIGLILKSEDYSLSRRLMRSAYCPAYAALGSQYIATRMLFVDELNKGNRTQMTLSEPSVRPLTSATFTKAWIESVSR
ncbi:MAG: outer membrane lipoprotein-sorting protein [Spirochaetia bacterium]|jgi:outer membrane lipoprotein-sorting protein